MLRPGWLWSVKKTNAAFAKKLRILLTVHALSGTTRWQQRARTTVQKAQLAA